MKHVRATCRLVLFTLWSSVLGATAVLAALLAWMAPRTGGALHAHNAQIWARGVALILNLRVTVRGKAPRPPFLLVSNHLGYVDIVTLMSQAPAVFVARADVAGWPFLGLLARAGSTIFVDRAQRRDVVRVNQRISSCLRHGRGVVMFPEGTSSSGQEVLPFRSSLLEPAVRIGHPVSYAHVTYRTPPASRPAGLAVCWWGDMTFPGHFYGLLQLPRIDATLTFGTEPVHAADRHQLAHTLWSAVTGLWHEAEARCA